MYNILDIKRKKVNNLKLGDWVKNYRNEHGLSMQAMADLCGFSKAYIGVLEKGINPKTNKPLSPTMQTFQKIATATNYDLEELLKVLDNNQLITVSPIQSSPLPDLTPKDEREIARDLEDMMHSMASAAYEGEDELEDVEAFKATLKSAMIQAKKIAKKKYTPKKYRKD